MSASRWPLLLVAASSLLAGCFDAEFSAITTPPPGREATLRDGDDDDRAIRLSRGVALAFSCTYKEKPCRGATARVDDGARLQVLPAYVDELNDTSYLLDQDASAVAAFVVVGSAAGRSTLTVDVEGKSYDFDVTVVDP